VIEKPNAVMIGLERSTGGAPLTQPDQIRAHLLFAQFVRRPPVVGCQPANRLDVNLLAPGCQPRQVHVLDHPASQWGHRHLPSFQDRLGPTGPTGRRDTLNCSNQRCRAPPRRSRSVQRSNFRPVWARNGIFRAPISSRIASKSNSLIRRIISLITCSNSLQAPTNFPVRMRRELAGKALIGTPVLGHLGRR